jgi:predicted ATPase/DNA-binding SARP family transcriptional activator
MKGVCRIELLGGLRVRFPGTGESAAETVVSRFSLQRSASLLAYLAYFGERPHPRDLLIELLWPMHEPTAGRNNLRVLLSSLRRELTPKGADVSLIVADRTLVGLRPGATTDVREFTAALDAAAHASSLSERAALWEAALHLYGGELLPGAYEEWVLTARLHLAERHLDALRQVALAREQMGDRDAAMEWARRAIQADPLREDAHFLLMRLYAAVGQPQAVLRQYQELERILRTELGETPSAEARALVEELRRGARTLVIAEPATVVRGPSTEITNRPPTGDAEPAASTAGETPPPRSPGPDGSVSEDAGSLVVGPSSFVGSKATLPVQLTRFFGREEEITQLTSLLCSEVTRLVTLTGPGGSGKTRLAIAAARRLEFFFGPAITFVPLADLADAARIPDAIAGALSFTRSAERTTEEQVASHLQGTPWLLVLDNYEHLVEPGALLVRRLLEQVPTLTCLVTSRQTLSVGGEQELPVRPLPTPRAPMARLQAPGARLKEGTAPGLERGAWSLGRLLGYPSVQLFLDRARAIRPEFELTEANAASVGTLCDRLDGLPLAIELAAARIGVLIPEQILEQLEQRFSLLVSRQRDLPARHRSLRAAVETSCSLLAPELQQFFRRLSVFRSGWTLEGAAVITGTPLLDTMEWLERLRECSLIVAEELSPHAGRPGMRYRMLESLREYGWEQLAASGELAATRTRHREWYLQLAEQADAAAHRPEQTEWLPRLEAELENLRAALGWCQEDADANPAGNGAEAGLRLAATLWWLWIYRGHLAEGLQWLEGALARGSQLPASLRAPALLRAAQLANHRGDEERYHTFLRLAHREYEQLLALARATGNRADIARTLVWLADVLFQEEDLDAAWTFCVEARPLLEELGEAHELARMLAEMVTVAQGRGDLRSVRGILEEHLAICRTLGASDLLVHALGAMGHLERDEGDYARARAFYRESLLLRRELGFLFALAQSLEDFAVLAGRQGEAERAIRLLGAAEAFCETLNARPPVAVAAEYERTVAEGRAVLGDAAFAAIWAEGRTMSLDEATEYALEGA